MRPLVVITATIRGKGSPDSVTERRVPELIPVFCSQPAGDVSHKPSSRLPLLSTRSAVTLATLNGLLPVCCLVNKCTMGVNSLPKTVTEQCRGYDLNPGPTLPESSTLTTWLPSHLVATAVTAATYCYCVCDSAMFTWSNLLVGIGELKYSAEDKVVDVILLVTRCTARHGGCRGCTIEYAGCIFQHGLHME